VPVPPPDPARDVLKAAIRRGVQYWNRRPSSDKDETIASEICKGSYLVTGGKVHLVQEVDHRGETADGQSVEYVVYVEDREL
jgi:hypothetical protein